MLDTVEYSFREAFNYGPNDPAFLDTTHAEMVIELIARKRRKERIAEQQRAAKAVAEGRDPEQERMGSEAVQKFLDAAERGDKDPFVAMGIKLPPGEVPEAAEPPEEPPEDISEEQQIALLEELGLVGKRQE